MARLRNRKKTKRLELNYKELKNKTFKALLLAIILWLCYQFIITIINQPIRYISIESSFQQVKEAQIKGAISSEVQDGILDLDVSKLYERMKNIEWIDTISISRKWPDRLMIEIHEHIPVARWGQSYLLNNRGELFSEISNPNLIPADLVYLNGPDYKSFDVAQRYFFLREKLIPLGINVTKVNLSENGAWTIELHDGTSISFGKSDVEKKFDLFIDIAKNILSNETEEIESIDLRYDNGFAIRLKGET
tara:strand:- start:926 stop:1672 length:747 start_codon:yes stop_codon:yes gene_type:complete